jgi:hypothetical protein
LTALIQQEWLQVSTPFDNVYSGSASTTVKTPATGFRSSDIGKEIDATGQYAFLGERNMILNVGVGRLFPGTLMRQKAHGAPLTLAYFGLTYKFKVNHKDNGK